VIKNVWLNSNVITVISQDASLASND